MTNPTHHTWIYRLLFSLVLAAPLLVSAQNDTAKPELTPYETALEDAVLIGEGVVKAYRSDNKTMIELPAGAFNRLFLWYTEIVGAPSGVAIDAIGFSEGLVARLERHGDVVRVRDLSSAVSRRPGSLTDESAEEPEPLADGEKGLSARNKIKPIEVSLARTSVGPIMASMPVLGEGPDGSVLVDITATFSNDIPLVTARFFLDRTSYVMASVDPANSYIDGIGVYPQDIDIRSHITFNAQIPVRPDLGLIPVSIVMGHSLVPLPEQPMAARLYNPRVGFFKTQFTEFDGAGGQTIKRGAVISRYRLEKANPEARFSDTVKPIVYYIGRGVPDQWRPYIKAGVEAWQPVFEIAGFSNAIVAMDAPSADEDPAWSPEDARHSIIRWLPESKQNAQGPRLVDPRSGEILSAHILIWPDIIDVIEAYYFSLFASVDPRAETLPFSQELRGELLQYVVSHEVGHSIGLRHNHIASTVFSIEHLRDATSANETGPNTSIMAYGRMNQVAQPGDGVTQLYSKIGVYDYFAIHWGYGVHGSTPEEEQHVLDLMAGEVARQRELFWADAEKASIPIPGRWMFDPRVQAENVGDDRVEATKLGIANIARAVEMLPAAVAANDELFNYALGTTRATHSRFLDSVHDLIGGVERALPFAEGRSYFPVSAARQREAVAYLLNEGIATLDIYKTADAIGRLQPLGGFRDIEHQQAKFVGKILSGTKLAILSSNQAADPDAYGELELARDVYAAVWGDLGDTPAWKRALQNGWLEHAQGIIVAEASGAPQEEQARQMAAASGADAALAAINAETGDDTLYPAWLRQTLPGLSERLKAAAITADSEYLQLYFATQSRRAARLAAQ